MIELFMAEWRRFSRYSLAAASLHLALQFVTHVGHFYLLDKNSESQKSMAMFYMAAALLFAGVQLAGYRSPGRWMWLMHRPQSRTAIFSGLALAGAAHIGLAIGLPLLLTVLGTDLLTTHPVDQRHYLGVIILTQHCMMAWLVVATVLLGRVWSGLGCLLFPFVLMSYDGPAGVVALVSTATLALMTLIAFENFKVDRSKAPLGWTMNLLAAMPTAIAAFWVIMLISTIGATTAEQAISGPRSAWPVISKSKEEAISSLDPKPRMQARLAASNHPNKEIWKDQLANAQFDGVWRDYRINGIRQALTNERQPGPFHTDDKVSWRFDHDRMLFIGTEDLTGKLRGVQGMRGLGDMTPFPIVPAEGREDKSFLLLPQQAWQVESGTKLIHSRLVLQAPERLVGTPKNIGGQYFVFTNRRLIAYKVNPHKADEPFVELYSVAIPDWPCRMDWIDIVRLPEATLISMATGNYTGRGKEFYEQQMVAVDQHGQASIVQQTRYEMRFSDGGWSWPSPYWMVSPAMLGASMKFREIYQDPFEADRWRHAIYLDGLTAKITLALMLASGLIAWYWVRQRAVRFQLAWVLSCLLIGLPALATLMLLHPKERSKPQI